jgi:hypothetical protein
MGTNFDLRKVLQEDRERRLLLGLTDERVRAYTDELWNGSSREEAFASATRGLQLDEAARAYIADSLNNLPGPGEV